MTYFFELFLLKNKINNISTFLKYDEDGYPIEDNEFNEECSDDDDLDGLYDDDLDGLYDDDETEEEKPKDEWE